MVFMINVQQLFAKYWSSLRTLEQLNRRIQPETEIYKSVSKLQLIVVDTRINYLPIEISNRKWIPFEFKAYLFSAAAFEQ